MSELFTKGKEKIIKKLDIVKLLNRITYLEIIIKVLFD